jgi:putative transposase
MFKQAAQMQKKEAEQHKPRKTYQFRIYPTHKQRQMLEQWLGCCCEVYNAALDERRSAYRIADVSLSYEKQCAELPGCKEVRPEISAVPSQVLQDVLKRVDLSFNAFFQRVREGQKAGYPRFVRCSKLRVYRVEGRK